MTQTLSAYIRLLRLDKRVGVYLLLWPCLWSMVLAYQDYAVALTDVVMYALLFTLGAFVMRSAGCVINDLWDRDIDPKVERTKHRPLASGEISVMQAMITLAILLGIGFFILMMLNGFTVMLGLGFAALVMLYPLAKRVLPIPQLVLGLTFNAGALMGYSALTGTLSASAWLLYLGCIFWTLGYDTIYAVQDVSDDKKVGVKSAAVWFGNYTRLFIAGCYVMMLINFIILGVGLAASYIYYLGMTLVGAHLYWQVSRYRADKVQDCMQKFVSNVYLGAFLFIVLVL